MPSESELIAHLREMSAAMREAARLEDWDKLVAMWPESQAMFAELQDRLAQRTDADSLAAMADDLRALMADANAVSDYARPWLQATGALLARWEQAEAKHPPGSA